MVVLIDRVCDIHPFLSIFVIYEALLLDIGMVDVVDENKNIICMDN